jgi:hypothetical protein
LFQVNIVSDPSCRCRANREDLSFLLRLFPLFKYKTYIVSKSQLAT